MSQEHLCIKIEFKYALQLLCTVIFRCLTVKTQVTDQQIVVSKLVLQPVVMSFCMVQVNTFKNGNLNCTWKRVRKDSLEF